MAQKLIVEIIGDSSQYERTLRRTAQQTKKFEANVSGLGRAGAKAGVGFFAADGLINGLATSISAASNLNEQMSKSRQVFAASSRDIESWSKSSATNMGLARDRALEAASSFGALLKPLGVTGDEAARQSEKLTQLGADLASFYNTDVTDALDAIRSGLVGESEPLRRYGVLLSEARVQQQALADTGKKSATELTDQEKVMARLKITLQDSAQAQGDFARTSEGAANQLRILKANARDFGASLAEDVLPPLTKVMQGLNWIAQHKGPSGKDILKWGGGGTGFAKGLLGDTGGGGNFALTRPPTSRFFFNGKPPGSWMPPGIQKILDTIAGTSKFVQGYAGATVARPGPTVEQRNQWFDAMIGRLLGRASDPTSLRQQIQRLRTIAGLIQQRLAITKDVTRRLTLEDQLADIAVEIRGRQQQINQNALRAEQEAAELLKKRAEAAREAKRHALELAKQRKEAAAAARQRQADKREAKLEERLGWLMFGGERAEATKTIKDDLRAQRQIEAYWRSRIAHEGRKLRFVEELWRTQQRIRDLNKKTTDPLAGLVQVSSTRMAALLGAGLGLSGGQRGMLAANIAGQEIHNYVHLDGREVARSVNRTNARGARRTANQTSGHRG